ncbi:hypothetical protein AB4Z48_25385 [Cupriavidus sp. 2TAF22]|uniref:hypothetical protein n=1 Tax=unclassified Cupriavidus TaxID=2640874 RepID=UPI003F8E173D
MTIQLGIGGVPEPDAASRHLLTSGSICAKRELDAALSTARAVGAAAAKFQEAQRDSIRAVLSRLGDVSRNLAHTLGDLSLAGSMPSSELLERSRIWARTLHSQVDGISHALERGYESIADAGYPPSVLFVGPEGSGKTTTREALFGSPAFFAREAQALELAPARRENPTDRAIANTPACLLVQEASVAKSPPNDAGVMAQRWDRSMWPDTLVLVLTDDDMAPGAFDSLAQAGPLRGRLAVLLNVKRHDEDLDLLIGGDGHASGNRNVAQLGARIAERIYQRFCIDAIEVTPIHARAAWLARHGAVLPPGVSAASLERSSNVMAAESAVLRLLTSGVASARLQAPASLLHMYVQLTRGCIDEASDSVRQLRDAAMTAVNSLELQRSTAARLLARSLDLLQSRFEAAADSIASLIDDALSEPSPADAISRGWRGMLDEHGLTDAAGWLPLALQANEATTNDMASFPPASDIGARQFDNDSIDVSQLELARHRVKSHRHARLLFRSISSTAAAIVAGWLISAVVDDTLWTIAATTILSMAVGLGVDKGVCRVTSRWIGEANLVLEQRRASLEKDLRDVLGQHHRRMHQWLHALSGSRYDGGAQGQLAASISEHLACVRSSLDAETKRLERIASKIDGCLLSHAFELVAQDLHREHIDIVTVARRPGVLAIASVAFSRSLDHAFKLPGESDGSKLKQLSEWLGGERLLLVDRLAPLERQVRQALGIDNCGSAIASVAIAPGREAATVLLSEMQWEQAIGAGSTSIQLAEQLLGISIHTGVLL